MQVDHTVPTCCPRCGKPITWRATNLPDEVLQLEVSGWSCHCPLSEEEWDDLADEAGDALQDRRDDSERAVRRVAEDPPP
jgi:hypothetical protein